MQNNKLFALLEPKIGSEAARIAVFDRYVTLFMGIFALAVVVIFRITPNEISGIVLAGISGVGILIVAAGVYIKTRLASLLSQHLNIKIAWYSLPNVLPVSKFDAWLASKRKG